MSFEVLGCKYPNNRNLRFYVSFAQQLDPKGSSPTILQHNSFNQQIEPVKLNPCLTAIVVNINGQRQVMIGSG